MSLRSDSILAVAGLFPSAITPEHHLASLAVPTSWEQRIAAWIATDQQAPFRYVPPPSPEEMDVLFSKLALAPNEPEVTRWIEGLGIEDPELIGDFYAGLTRAREHLVNAWPKLSLDSPAGPKVLPLSLDDREEVWSLYQVLDSPDRVIEELESRTLTPTQAEAFRAGYPDLYDHANQAIDRALTERLVGDAGYEPSVAQAAVINTLRGQAPEAPFIPPPKPAPSGDGKVKIDTERDRTQAEVSSDPGGGEK